MSLDVYLCGPKELRACGTCGHETLENTYNFVANITHNLAKMADAAGIYEALWRPEEKGIKKASELIEPLTKGLALLKSKPDHFQQFDSPNGWGRYEHFVPWVEKYLEACVEYPDSEINVSR